MLPLLEPARTRIIRLTNVHFDADKEVIEKFFAGYTIEDQFRTVNSRTGIKSVVYVLFANVSDRIRACHEKSGHKILGRSIKIQPAQIGNYEREYISKPSKVHVLIATNSEQRRDEVRAHHRRRYQQS